MRVASIPEAGAVDFVSRSHAFFGRSNELAALVAAVPTARPGRPLVRFVVGSPGVGKSALLQRVARKLSGDGALLLSSRCRQQGSPSYRALDGVLDALVRHLLGLPDEKIAALMPAHAELMGRSFPALLRVPAFARNESLPFARATARFDRSRTEPRVSSEAGQQLHPIEQRNRAFVGLRDLLARLCAEQPVVLVLDDMHWVDLDSLSVLSTLLAGHTAPPLTLLATLYPEGEPGLSEQAVSASELQRLLMTSGQPLELAGLDESAALAFAEHLLAGAEPRLRTAAATAGSQGESLASTIAREAGGHPRLIEQWVLLLKECPGETGGASLHEILRSRLGQLRPAARQLATLLGLAEGPVPLRVLAHAAQLTVAEVEREAAALRLSRLCRVTQGPDGDSMELAHHRVRELTLAHVTPGERIVHHAALARAYAELFPNDDEALGKHLQLAEQSSRAAESFARAADRALDALAFARAARLYRKSIALTGPLTTSERHARLGDALTSWGRVAEGGRAYLAAAGQERTLQALTLRRRAAEQLLVCGQLAAGAAAAAGLVEALKLPIADGQLAGLARTALRWLKLRATGVSFKLRDASEIAATELLRVDASWSLFVGFAPLDPMRAQDPLSLNIVLALRAGEPMRVARGLSGLAIVLEMTRGQSALAQEFIERAESLAERLDSPHVRGLCHLHAGIRAFNSGHAELAKANLEQAEQAFLLSSSGAPWELSVTQFVTLLCHMASGDVPTFRRLSRDWHEEALARGDLLSADNLRVRVLPAVLLLEGDLRSARRTAELPVLASPRKVLSAQAYWREVSLVECDLFEGSSESALRRVRALWPELKRSTLLRLRAVHLEAHWLRARVLLAALEAGDPAASAQQVLAEVLEVEQSEMAGAHGLAAALRGALQAQRGELEAARASFRSAELALGDSGRELLAKLALLRRTMLTTTEHAQRARRDAELWLSGAGVADTPALLRMMMPGGLARSPRP